MFVAALMTGKLIAMEFDGTDLSDLYYDTEECIRVDTFLSEGTPVVIVEYLDSLNEFGLPVEVVAREEETDDHGL